ncbi:hypothetical protein EMPS_09305 [Entomortierella parvispora]|uniref:Uncharacterized protein n=1 Tax=Entomortierella parvispora TaxID=205924 RepID=A0A9P3LZX1_9FUNG|nr:hypothetical protein EMPS_09305 [Entomortierella parvispora]
MTSFIYNFFTSSEKENATALRATLQEHGCRLKTQGEETDRLYKAQLVSLEETYKAHLKQLEQEYKLAKQHARDEMHRTHMRAVQQEMDLIMESEPYIRSDPKTKSKLEGLKAIMNFFSDVFLALPTAAPAYTESVEGSGEVPSVAAAVAANGEMVEERQTYPDEKSTAILISP